MGAASSLGNKSSYNDMKWINILNLNIWIYFGQCYILSQPSPKLASNSTFEYYILLNVQPCKIALIYVSNSWNSMEICRRDPPSVHREMGCFLSCPLFILHRSCLDSGATSVSRPQHSFACSVVSGQLSLTLCFKHLNKKTFPHLSPSLSVNIQLYYGLHTV